MTVVPTPRDNGARSAEAAVVALAREIRITVDRVNELVRELEDTVEKGNFEQR